MDKATELDNFVGRITDADKISEIKRGLKFAVGIPVKPKTERKGIVLSLCPRCRSEFQSIPENIVKRLDPFQADKEMCDKCQVGYGYLVLGKMRVDVDSFEDWYAGQFHYEKVNGERPGKKYGKTLSPLTVAKVLGIPRSTANDLMNDGIVEFIWVDGKRRIKRESFDKWYASQSKYTKVKEIEEVEGYVD